MAAVANAWEEESGLLKPESTGLYSDSAADGSAKPPSRVTMYDVAKAAGVSQALVSYAYRNAPGVSRETRARIISIGRQLGFRPNQNAARLASRSSRTLGLFLHDIRNPFVADVFDGVKEVVEQHDIHLLIAIGDPESDQDRVQFDDLLSGKADVIIAAGTVLDDKDITDLFGVERLVSVGRRIPGIDSVATNEDSAAQLVVGHLIGLGHSKIAMVAGPPVADYDSRRRAFERALSAHGLTAQAVTAPYTQAAAAVAIAPLLDKEDDRPTAIFANNDVAALGVMEALSHRGLRVPQDCSVVGFDNSPIAAFPAISLTSVEQNARTLGRLAAECAIKRIATPHIPPQTIRNTPELIVRGTTGPPP